MTSLTFPTSFSWLIKGQNASVLVTPSVRFHEVPFVPRPPDEAS